MAMNSISENQGDGNISAVNINGQGQPLQSINSIVKSIKDDIGHLKDQFHNLPTAPNEKPPSPLAKF